LFPEYTYTKAQKKRLLLFQGRVEHFRAAINYADSFDKPNQIMLLYMIGYNPKIKSYVEKTKHNVVALCAHVSPDLLRLYDDYWNLMEKYKGAGLADKDGELNQFYYESRNKRESSRNLNAITEEVYLTYAPEDQLIDAYEAAKQGIIQCFDQYTVIEKGKSEYHISFSQLDDLVAHYFAYGREKCGVGEKAYVGLKKIQDALELGLHREDATKVLDLSDGTETADVCRKAIRRCEMNISVALRNYGYIDLVTLMETMKCPPYGWDDDPHAAYCFGCAVSSFLEGTWIWDEVNAFQTRETALPILRNVLRGSLGRRRSFVLFSEGGQKLSERFAYIFGVDQGNYTPKDEMDNRILELLRSGLSERKIAVEIGTVSNVAIHKRISKMRTSFDEQIPFCNMSHLVCEQITTITRWPVALVDKQLQEALMGVFDETRTTTDPVCTPIFGKQYVREMLSYFTVEKCKALKERIKTINEDIPALLRGKYGSDIDVADIQRFCTTTDSGWLWDCKMFFDCVEHYLKERDIK
jgi:hypothetical protein